MMLERVDGRQFPRRCGALRDKVEEHGNTPTSLLGKSFPDFCIFVSDRETRRDRSANVICFQLDWKEHNQLLCVFDTSEINLVSFGGGFCCTVPIFILVFLLFLLGFYIFCGTGNSRAARKKGCPFCTDWIPISDWETVGPSLSIFQQQPPLSFLAETLISRLFVCCVYVSRGYCRVMPSRPPCYSSSLFLFFFPFIVSAFISYSFDRPFWIRTGKQKAREGRWRVCRGFWLIPPFFGNASHKLIQLIQLCFGRFWLKKDRPIFVLKSLPYKSFLSPLTVNPVFGEMNSAELATFLVFLSPATDGGQISTKRGEKKKKKEKKVRQKRKEGKKIRERMKEKRGAAVCVFR